MSNSDSPTTSSKLSPSHSSDDLSFNVRRVARVENNQPAVHRQPPVMMNDGERSRRSERSRSPDGFRGQAMRRSLSERPSRRYQRGESPPSRPASPIAKEREPIPDRSSVGGQSFSDARKRRDEDARQSMVPNNGHVSKQRPAVNYKAARMDMTRNEGFQDETHDDLMKTSSRAPSPVVSRHIPPKSKPLQNDENYDSSGPYAGVAKVSSRNTSPSPVSPRTQNQADLGRYEKGTVGRRRSSEEANAVLASRKESEGFNVSAVDYERQGTGNTAAVRKVVRVDSGGSEEDIKGLSSSQESAGGSHQQEETGAAKNSNPVRI